MIKNNASDKILFVKKVTYHVTPEDKSKRLDTYIPLESGLSRSYVQKLFKKGLILVNSIPQKASYRLRRGDIIEVSIPNEPPLTLAPEDIPLDVIYEDEHIIVVNKPSGMVVYPSAGHKSATLLNAIISRCKKLASQGGPLRPGIVHRLDKDTTGVMIIAKDDKAYVNLTKQFRERMVEKHYRAISYGNIKKEYGEIRSHIGRSISDRKKMSIRTRKGKEAITEFKVIKRLKLADIIDVKIITGRTHQIRVHFASIGHPVLGDRVYGKKTFIKIRQKSIIFSRQMLHAYSLKLNHPLDGRPLEFIAPMPEDMERAIKEIA
ncbi:MAG: RluA family pseudouridine synthase [Nitrospirae bacterium]|nr:RluA family pseudouridine synthase [Nitrospirota bacterium]